jgi:acyl dehydratase
VRVINGFDELAAISGEEIGKSEWVEVTQEMVDRFADVTGDDQWIHTDVEKAAEQSPFGGTIAHGFLTLALIPRLCRKIYKLTGISASVNYGLNKVRFFRPVRVGSRIRLGLRVRSTRRIGTRAIRFVSQITIEVDGADKPACIAETVTLVLREAEAKAPRKRRLPRRAKLSKGPKRRPRGAPATA